jgi:hypothetical protein
MLAMTFDGSAIRAFVNGSLDARAPDGPHRTPNFTQCNERWQNPAPISTWTTRSPGTWGPGGAPRSQNKTDFTVGGQRGIPCPDGVKCSGLGHPWSGLVGGLAVYDRALNSTELLAMARQTGMTPLDMPSWTRGSAVTVSVDRSSFQLNASMRSQEAIDVRVVIIDHAEQVAFDASTQQCTPDDFPDLPVRAIRVPAGGIRAYAASGTLPGGYGSFATEIDAAWQRNCSAPFLLSEARAPQRPESYTGPLWLASTYSHEHHHERHLVTGLAHLEFHGEAQANTSWCPSGRAQDCWYASALHVESHDGGLTFQQAPPRLAMASPFRYVPSAGQQGAWTTTNLLRPKQSDPYTYVLAMSIQPQVTRAGREQDGMCVFRSHDLRDPAAWRGWNGSAHGWSVTTIDPYAAAASGAGPWVHMCEPVLPAEFRFSWSHHAESGAFIAFGIGAAPPGSPPGTNAFTYTWSRDLLRWPVASNRSAHRGSLLTVHGMQAWQAGGVTGRWYPSVLDPASRGANFEFIETPRRTPEGGWRSSRLRPPLLHFTRLAAKPNRSSAGQRRDLVRVPLEVTIQIG